MHATDCYRISSQKIHQFAGSGKSRKRCGQRACKVFRGAEQTFNTLNWDTDGKWKERLRTLRSYWYWKSAAVSFDGFSVVAGCSSSGGPQPGRPVCRRNSCCRGRGTIWGQPMDVHACSSWSSTVAANDVARFFLHLFGSCFSIERVSLVNGVNRLCFHLCQGILTWLSSWMCCCYGVCYNWRVYLLVVVSKTGRPGRLCDCRNLTVKRCKKTEPQWTTLQCLYCAFWFTILISGRREATWNHWKCLQ